MFFVVMVAIVLMIFIGINIQAENQVTITDDTEMPELMEYQNRTADQTVMEINLLWVAIVILIVFMVLASFHFLFGRRIF